MIETTIPRAPEVSPVASAARSYRSAGLSVLPVKAGEKRPAVSWSEYQSRLPSVAEITTWFGRGRPTDKVGIVCGAVSGHVEVIDFDCGGAAFEDWRGLVNEATPDLLERLVIEASPSGGKHAAYRCDGPVDGNTQLAQQQRPGAPAKTLIETRGEGGFIVCAPSPGYVLEQGAFERLPLLTADERDTLLSCARRLNEVSAEVIGGDAPPLRGEGKRPGDDFAERGDVGEVLRRNAWTLFRDGANQHWTRPGKEAGTSATLRDGVFYVFTSNAPPFKAGTAYGPFAVFALLEHRGDFSAASSALRQAGYGERVGVAASPTTEATSRAGDRLGTRDPVSGKLQLCRYRTLPTAEAYMREFHASPDGTTLVSFGGEFHEWRAHENRWRPVEDGEMQKRVFPWLNGAAQAPRDRSTTVKPFDANPRTVDDALKSLHSLCHMSAARPAPLWREGLTELPNLSELVVCSNGSLNLRTGEYLAPTPLLFNVSALSFAYDPAAPAPERWLRFLGELWPDDPQSIGLLQEWAGYCLTADTSQQKMLLIVGPRRAGKGTISGVLRNLLGESNVVGPTTSSLTGEFGLAPLLHKQLAVVSDARFQSELTGPVVERLLCISGEDPLTINRKNKEQVTVRLPTRFMFTTNETPALRDASGALAGRFLCLQLTRSFFGVEDIGLAKALLPELPGILLWAIEGWRRLQERGRFSQPESATTLLQEMESLGAPVVRFVHERCELGPGNRVMFSELFDAYCDWRKDRDFDPIRRELFGREMSAAFPHLTPRRTTGHTRFYERVGLKRAE